MDRVSEVEALLREVLGDGDVAARHQRLADVRDAATVGEHLEYGELDVRSVARVLAATGVDPDERFVDIGSGEGLPVLAAALLYPDTLTAVRGIELVPERLARAHRHAERLRVQRPDVAIAPVTWLEGDVYTTAGPTGQALADSTLALCFATTWSRGAPRRELPRLSRALAETMPPGARVVIV
ncbi:MAG: hypothetical protein AAF211_28750, partial [Myxococcota bacterium]